MNKTEFKKQSKLLTVIDVPIETKNATSVTRNGFLKKEVAAQTRTELLRKKTMPVLLLVVVLHRIVDLQCEESRRKLVDVHLLDHLHADLPVVRRVVPLHGDLLFDDHLFDDHLFVVLHVGLLHVGLLHVGLRHEDHLLEDLQLVGHRWEGLQFEDHPLEDRPVGDHLGGHLFVTILPVVLLRADHLWKSRLFDTDRLRDVGRLSETGNFENWLIRVSLLIFNNKLLFPDLWIAVTGTVSAGRKSQRRITPSVIRNRRLFLVYR